MICKKQLNLTGYDPIQRERRDMVLTEPSHLADLVRCLELTANHLAQKENDVDGMLLDIYPIMKFRNGKTIYVNGYTAFLINPNILNSERF